MEFKNWVLGGVVLLLVGVLSWMLNAIATRTLNRLDAILDELRKLTTMMDRHELELKNIQDVLKDHEDRIRTIEKD